MKARLYFTVPGTVNKIRGECTYPNASSTHPRFNQFILAMRSKGVHGVRIKDGNGFPDSGYDWEGWYDTVPGWGCLDQDWFEVETEVDTSWGWCKIAAFTNEEWNPWWEEFHSGRFLMMVFYVKADGTFTPHH